MLDQRLGQRVKSVAIVLEDLHRCCVVFLQDALGFRIDELGKGFAVRFVRDAEEVVYGGRTTGAAYDMQQATNMARQMVTRRV